ncbi:MAG TPA: DPP IV N-terminal domain-containing protein [Thermoanaerobaculia bacterium]|jgi:dipeptidyl-peptidase-4|nr:DPP IV N-terminal domain-containing protein [Thermoanaerobaculia bacterium]
MLKNCSAALLLFVAVAALAQDVKTTPQAKPTIRELTLENVFDPKQRVSFGGTPQGGFHWLDDKTFAWPRTEEGKVVEHAVIETETGNKRVLFNAAKLEAAAKKIAGVSGDEAAAFAKQRGWNFSPNKKSVLLNIGNDVYMYTFDADSMTRLTSSAGEKEEVTFSPDGRFVSFVRDNNVYVVDVATQRERQLTTDGNENIQNGILDWVYQEEVYGRGTFRAYWWSPDSTRIAYLQLDERPVKHFAVVDHIPYQQNVESELYPKAGAPNPIAKLFCVNVNGAAPKEISTESYSGADFLIVLVDWSPDSSKVVYQIQNREQTWLDLNAADVRGGGAPKTLFRETTKAWVDISGNPVWLKDGSFLWLSERTGFKHLYHYAADGKLIAQLTNGPWEVRTVHGVDAANDWIYFSGTERSVLGSDLYRLHLDGSGLKRLSEAPGQHNANFNPSLTAYLDTFSDVATPPSTSLHRADGTRIRVVDANEAPLMRDLHISKPELMQVKTRDGFVMEAMMIKPPDFDPSKKYPVYEFTYSGPHAQSVRNSWGGAQYLFHQFLAQHGVIVWICDNRSASGKGAESAWTSYKRMGEGELRDLEDGLKWLTSQPYVDGSRVALSGWSYGGFMTSFALTHSTLWIAGLSGGTVSDWRDYDSIYTERVMLMPQNNPEGYKATAPRWAAKDLHGNILLMHGTIDDNVHIQNTIQFIYELEKANKPYQLQVYPKSRHGVVDPALNAHMRAAMWKFIQENLGVK